MYNKNKIYSMLVEIIVVILVVGCLISYTIIKMYQSDVDKLNNLYDIKNGNYLYVNADDTSIYEVAIHNNGKEIVISNKLDNSIMFTFYKSYTSAIELIEDCSSVTEFSIIDTDFKKYEILDSERLVKFSDSYKSICEIYSIYSIDKNIYYIAKSQVKHSIEELEEVFKYVTIEIR